MRKQGDKIKPRPPTEVQLKFRDKYLECGMVTQACEHVGRSRAWGYAQIEMPYMKEALANRNALIKVDPVGEREYDTVNKRAKWLEGVVKGEILDTQTIRDKEGNEYTVEKPFPARDRVQAMKLLGMMSGDYVVKQEIKTEHTERRVVVVVPEPMSLPRGESRLLPTGEDVYEDCSHCGEQVLEKDLEMHEGSCPGV